MYLVWFAETSYILESGQSPFPTVWYNRAKPILDLGTVALAPPNTHLMNTGFYLALMF